MSGLHPLAMGEVEAYRTGFGMPNTIHHASHRIVVETEHQITDFCSVTIPADFVYSWRCRPPIAAAYLPLIALLCENRDRKLSNATRFHENVSPSLRRHIPL